MARLRVSVRLDAPPSVVGDDLCRLDSHSEWMLDADAIRFTSATRQGVGATLECDTSLGPIQLTDRMTVTEWVPKRRIGVRHEGVVSGHGTIRLSRRPRRRTKVTWSEQLRFPWWMGGPIGSWLAAPMLVVLWRRSMRRLGQRFAGGRRLQPSP